MKGLRWPPQPEFFIDTTSFRTIFELGIVFRNFYLEIVVFFRTESFIFYFFANG